MAQTSFIAYLYVVRDHERAFAKAMENAMALDVIGALPRPLADAYYTSRDKLYLEQLSLSNALRQAALSTSVTLSELVPRPALAPNLPVSPPQVQPPDASSAPVLAVNLRGLGNPAVPAAAASSTLFVVAAILASVALLAVIAVLAVSAYTVAEALKSYQVVEAYNKTLERRTSFIEACVRTGGDVNACVASAAEAFPTPRDGLPEPEPTPWYLRGSTYVLLGGAVATVYLFSLYKRHLGPEPSRVSAGIAGGFALPRQLNSGQASSSTYALEV